MNEPVNTIILNGREFRLVPMENPADEALSDDEARFDTSTNLAATAPAPFVVVRTGRRFHGDGGRLASDRRCAKVLKRAEGLEVAEALKRVGELHAPELLPANTDEIAGMLLERKREFIELVRARQPEAPAEGAIPIDELISGEKLTELRALVAEVLSEKSFPTVTAIIDTALRVGVGYVLGDLIETREAFQEAEARAAHFEQEAARLDALFRDPELAGMQVHENWVRMGMEGAAAQVFASAFAHQFKASKGINYVEMSLSSADPEIGPLLVTLQRQEGPTPSQLREAAEKNLTDFKRKCLPWLAALKALADEASPMVSAWLIHKRDEGDTVWVERCTRWVQEKTYFKGTLKEPEAFVAALAETEECPFRGYRLRSPAEPEKGSR